MKNFSNRAECLKYERKKKSLSVRRLAILAGIPPSTLQSMDREDWNPTLKVLIALEEVLL